MIASVWSVDVVDAEVINVTGAVVAIHNVPGEGDVGAVLGGLEVANNFLGIYMCWYRMIQFDFGSTRYASLCLTCECSTQQDSCCRSEKQQGKGCHL